MIPAAPDLVAIGDAIVDVIASCDDSFLADQGFEKGTMRLLTDAQAAALYQAMGPARESSGGSAANSMAGAAALGLSTAFVGQTANDQLGAIFAHDMRALGVEFETPAIEAPPTGVCLILVTPDAQRTMSTCPGASHMLTAAALDPELIRSARFTFLEGYLWGPERPRAAMLEAARIARSAGRQVVFTLSESLAIGDRREGVMGMVETGAIDLLFGNEEEVRHLTGCSATNDCLDALAGKVETVVVTRGAAGAVAQRGGRRIEAPAAPAKSIVDTTGAGDMFAAGFMLGRCREQPLEACLHLGAIAAAEVVSHFGARPEADLRALVRL